MARAQAPLAVHQVPAKAAVAQQQLAMGLLQVLAAVHRG
jgi:hypothetical protein